MFVAGHPGDLTNRVADCEDSVGIVSARVAFCSGMGFLPMSGTLRVASSPALIAFGIEGLRDS